MGRSPVDIATELSPGATAVLVDPHVTGIGARCLVLMRTYGHDGSIGAASNGNTGFITDGFAIDVGPSLVPLTRCVST